MKKLSGLLLFLFFVVVGVIIINIMLPSIKILKHKFTEHKNPHALVLLTDIGFKSATISSIKGVAFSVNPNLKVFDATHDLPNNREYGSTWDASSYLREAVNNWPSGTVFVSVVDPFHSNFYKLFGDNLVAKLKTGQYVVTFNSGILTLLDDSV